MRYSALAPGKRVRPVLCLLSAEAVGGQPLDALDGACAVEMVHAFSLVHDDLPAIDNDDLRRGRPTCHVEFGEAVAILAGDALFALAFETLVSADAPSERIVKATRCLTRAVGSDGLVGGETVDILSEGSVPSRQTVEFIHSRKTGALIAASCEIGAILGGGTDACRSRLYVGLEPRLDWRFRSRTTYSTRRPRPSNSAKPPAATGIGRRRPILQFLARRLLGNWARMLLRAECRNLMFWVNRLTR